MGCFFASRDGARLQVCEQVRNDKGEVWADASSWYWAALWSGAKRPPGLTSSPSNWSHRSETLKFTSLKAPMRDVATPWS